MTTILVTGANRGIGLEFVQQYTAEGADMIACCREPAKATALKAIKGNVRVMALDVADPKSVEALVRDLKGEAIDIIRERDDGSVTVSEMTAREARDLRRSYAGL